MDPFDLELEKLELGDMMKKARKKLTEMEHSDLRKKMFLKHIERNAFKNIKNITDLEQVLYGNIG